MHHSIEFPAWRFSDSRLPNDFPEVIVSRSRLTTTRCRYGRWMASNSRRTSAVPKRPRVGGHAAIQFCDERAGAWSWTSLVVEYLRVPGRADAGGAVAAVAGLAGAAPEWRARAGGRALVEPDVVPVGRRGRDGRGQRTRSSASRTCAGSRSPSRVGSRQPGRAAKRSGQGT